MRSGFWSRLSDVQWLSTREPGNIIGSSAGFSSSPLLSMVLNSSIVGSRHWTADFSAVSSTERNAFSAETNNGVPMQAFRPL